MFSINIEKGDNWKWKDFITISPGQKSATVTHSQKVFDKTVEPVKKMITREKYDYFLNLFNSIDFHKVFKENINIDKLDGWTLSCNISNGKVQIGVEIWNPAKNSSNSESLKFFEACDQVLALFEV